MGESDVMMKELESGGIESIRRCTRGSIAIGLMSNFSSLRSMSIYKNEGCKSFSVELEYRWWAVIVPFFVFLKNREIERFVATYHVALGVNFEGIR